jgi:hypothetical protein
MLCSVNQLRNATLAARDGDIGSVREVYFDDARWVIRHLVVGTGGWLSGRNVLISPHAIERIDAGGQRLVASLTRQQVEEAPGVDTNQPVSRQHEIALYDYYGYPYWWAGAGMWGAAAYPLAGAALAAPRPHADDTVASEVRARQWAERDAGDAHLRSSAEVIGYGIEAKDGSIGHIDDFLFDGRSWQIRYAEVDTRNWLPGKHVLVAPEWIDSIDWHRRKVHFAMTRAAVESSPPYEGPARLGEDSLQRLQRHYEGWL